MLNTQVVPGIHIRQIRKIKLKRSARFIKHQYSRDPGLVTIILKDLKLPTLEIRRKIKRLCLFHKAFHHQVAINIPDYIKQQNRTTRQYHPRKFRNVQSSSNTYTDSQFPSWLLRTGIIYHQICWIWMM